MGPLLLEDGDENEVELIQKGAIGASSVVVVGELDDEIDNEVANTCRC